MTSDTAVTHYTPEEHDQPACDADVDADPGTVMWGTLNPQRVSCPACLTVMNRSKTQPRETSDG
jgi:hypothetical protein